LKKQFIETMRAPHGAPGLPRTQFWNDYLNRVLRYLLESGSEGSEIGLNPVLLNAQRMCKI